ncbi:hypothetical protein SAMN04487851_10963 [Prevotella sp. tc2-28]|jgi:hypothetical protein|uniref:DUF6029 family protein n=1 Tax=Prevotella sp. tc2-28 TaxID=1761888 RepID=UPI00089B8F47|nr:DUF6029 family protein [Prevotella sp. tc2-28]SEA59808.1 hypothetical protein SAMN04487851_10963 [Prevotella sp. tc2-28]
MKRISLYAAFLSCSLAVAAQEDQSQQQGLTLSGSIQSDMLIPQNDDKIGAKKTDDFLTNTYVDLLLQSQHVDAGARLEYLEHPLPGFENDFKGWGVPNFWVKGRLGCAELTAGTFYEQFGSGFILRTYEERSLGIDNSLLGGRLVVKPIDGLTLKVLSGKQRRYWSWKGGLVSGADAEINLDKWFPALQQHDTRLTLGASWVNKYEKDEEIFADLTHRYNLPKYVNAWDVRANLNHGPWGVLVEYARKTQDPSFDNLFNYDAGQVAMFSGSYSRHGLSVLLQAKRSENMSFRSQRNMMGTSAFINHLPAFTLDHTYALAALYPYATQLASGEWAYQAELGYNFKRKTAIGGKYGMNVKFNYSYVRSIQKAWFKWGTDTYYQDLNVQLTRRFTRGFKLNFMYMNQRYNKSVIEGEGGMVHSNIFVGDGMFQLAPKTKLRCELQYLQTKQDQGDWVYGLLELSLAPHWMVTVSDMWNCGDSDMAQYSENTHYHYYQGLVTYNIKSHRIQLGYGRTRAGYNCSGGVCRYVPATKGVTLTYNYNF